MHFRWRSCTTEQDFYVQKAKNPSQILVFGGVKGFVAALDWSEFARMGPLD